MEIDDKGGEVGNKDRKGVIDQRQINIGRIWKHWRKVRDQNFEAHKQGEKAH